MITPNLAFIPSAGDFLRDVGGDIKLNRVEALLQANSRLDMLRDRAEYIQMTHAERPASWFEFSKYLAHCGAMNPERQPNSTVFVGAVGACLGAALCNVGKSIFPKLGLNYISSMLAGGMAALAYNGWQEGKQEHSQIKQCVDAYENYLDHFQQEKIAGRPAPRLREELVVNLQAGIGR